MQSFLLRLRALFSRAYAWALVHKVWSAIIVIGVLGGGYLAYAHYAGTGSVSQYVIAPATPGTLTVSVTGSGQVAANQTLELSPKSSGEVTYVGVKAGDVVQQGALIARVDDTEAQKQLRDAEASLTSAQIAFQQTTASTAADKTKAKATAFSASSDAVTDVSATLKTLDAALFDISPLPGHTSQAYIDAYASIVGGAQGTAERDSVKAAYQDAQAAYDAALAAAGSVSPTSSDADVQRFTAAAYDAAVQTATAVSATHSMMTVVNDKLTRADGGIPAAFTSTLTAVASADTTMGSDVSSVFSAKDSLDSALATLADTGGTTLDQQSAQLALTKAQNAVEDAQENLADYTVTAPFAGTIAKVDVQVHDEASGAVATLITNEEYAELSLNEVDAAEVKDGQKAALSFDAIDGLTIAGTVAEVDSIGTVTQGVVTYDVKIAFDTQDARVKPGMTVDATITTDSVADALIVPSSAVTSVGKQSFVQVASLASSATESSTTPARGTRTVDAASVTVTRIPVDVGVSNDTETQIIGGLSPGEYVVVSTKTGTASAAAAKTSATTRTGGLGGGGNAVFVRKGG